MGPTPPHPPITPAPNSPDPITPWPAPLGQPALLYGGSFDPPHLAHTTLAATARDLARPDAWLVYVPAARNPLKPTGPLATPQHRLEMLRLALRHTPRAAIWTDEIDRAAAHNAPAYWIDTLRRALAPQPSPGPLAFLIGADQALQFHLWREPRLILSLSSPVVLPRGSITTPGGLRSALAETRAWSVAELDDWASRLLPLKPLHASSTLARSSHPAHILDPAVLDYALRHRLYTPPPHD